LEGRQLGISGRLEFGFGFSPRPPKSHPSALVIHHWQQASHQSSNQAIMQPTSHSSQARSTPLVIGLGIEWHRRGRGDWAGCLEEQLPA